MASALGCGADDDCGPGQIPAAGVTALIGDQTATYGSFTSSPNNDCSRAGHPTSLTLDGIQSDPPSTFHITFCLPQPDEIGPELVPLDDPELIEVITVSADFGGGCAITLDSSVAATGSMELIGYFADGLAAEGYAIRLSGTVGGTRTCNGSDAGTIMESVAIDLGGEAAVLAL